MSTDISEVPIICRKGILHHTYREVCAANLCNRLHKILRKSFPICADVCTKSCLVLNGAVALSLFGKLLYVFSNAIDRN